MTEPWGVTVKAPESCTPAEIQAFAKLVVTGGEVDAYGLRARVERAKVLAFARFSGRLVGSGALKRPNTNYPAIVTIVETYTELRKRPGWTDEAIFNAIERRRNAFTPGGQLPSPLTLTGYVSYRLELEHGHGDMRLTDEVTADAVRQSLAYFCG